MQRHVAIVFGTRPEAIKLFPVVYALRARNDLRVSVWVTGQHRAMLDQVLSIAAIEPDLDLDLMVKDQTLDGLTGRLLVRLGEALDRDRPDCVIVQGDTTTAMVATLACFYRKVPVAHVEAGLRTGNNHAPWPEEVNRRIISTIADIHFAPTKWAAENLIKENVDQARIYVTGNTGIDALFLTQKRMKDFGSLTSVVDKALAPYRGNNVILVTAHRRESFDGGLSRIAGALRLLAKRCDVIIVFPVHPNPTVLRTMCDELNGCKRILLIDPLDYVPFVYLMSLSRLILTDSGGVQEEAPSLGKPVLVMRDTTERPEGIQAGTSKLVGTNATKIVTEAERLLDNETEYQAVSKATNPFGDGQASNRIAKVVHDYL